MSSKWDISGADIELLERKLKIVGIEIANPAKLVVFLFLYRMRETGPKDASKMQKALYKTLGVSFHLSTALASWVENNLLSADEKSNYTLAADGIELAYALDRFFRRIKKYERIRKKL